MTQGKKEEIQENMIRSALHFWNIKNVENLDPLVRLLIEGLSEQLYVLSGEMYDMENRVIQRICIQSQAFSRYCLYCSSME